MKYIKKLDQFGVPIQLNHKYQSEYHSHYGGFTTLIIYGISLTYSIYYVLQWKTGRVLANVQTQISTLDLDEIFVQNLLSVGEINSKILTDPFALHNNIFTPFLFKFSDNDVFEKEAIFSSIWKEGQDRPLVGLNDITLFGQKGKFFKKSDSYLGRQVYLVFSKCQSEVIAQYNGTCASKELMELYNQNHSIVFDINFQLESYNADSNQFNEFYKSYFVGYDNKNVGLSEVSIQTSSVEVDTGLLLERKQQKTIVSSVDFYKMNMDYQFAQFYEGLEIISIITIHLDNFQTHQTVIFPKLGEILAAIGSVIELLLLINYIMTPINEYLLQKSLLKQTLIYCYPQVKDLSIFKNKDGRVTHVYLKDQELDLNQFIAFQTHFRDRLEEYKNLSFIIAKLIQFDLLITKCQLQDDIYNEDLPIRLKPINTQKQIEMKQQDEQNILINIESDHNI